MEPGRRFAGYGNPAYEDDAHKGLHYGRLEDVDVSGYATMHGPVRVRMP
jgi:hypothetical protein